MTPEELFESLDDAHKSALVFAVLRQRRNDKRLMPYRSAREASIAVLVDDRTTHTFCAMIGYDPASGTPPSEAQSLEMVYRIAEDLGVLPAMEEFVGCQLTARQERIHTPPTPRVPPEPAPYRGITIHTEAGPGLALNHRRPKPRPKPVAEQLGFIYNLDPPQSPGR